MSDLGFGKVIWATEGRWDQSRGQVETGRPLQTILSTSGQGPCHTGLPS